MANQISTQVPRLGRQRLEELGRILEDTCLRMEALGVPDTLLHNDMNSGNILFRELQCTFTDWCEAGIGNPFLTFHNLCLLAADRKTWLPQLRELYRRCWSDLLSPCQIDTAFALAPLLATLFYESANDKVLWSTYLETFFVDRACRSLELEYAARFLACQPLRDLTPYKGILSVPPAHYLALRKGPNFSDCPLAVEGERKNPLSLLQGLRRALCLPLQTVGRQTHRSRQSHPRPTEWRHGFQFHRLHVGQHPHLSGCFTRRVT